MTPVEITAPTAGSIILVMVSVGQAVAAHQELILIESMKMEIPVASPATGKVVAILVKAADPVNRGDVLARIQPG